MDKNIFRVHLHQNFHVVMLLYTMIYINRLVLLNPSPNTQVTVVYKMCKAEQEYFEISNAGVGDPYIRSKAKSTT